jgi:hypothetical protein
MSAKIEVGEQHEKKGDVGYVLKVMKTQSNRV